MDRLREPRENRRDGRCRYTIAQIAADCGVYPISYRHLGKSVPTS